MADDPRAPFGRYVSLVEWDATNDPPQKPAWRKAFVLNHGGDEADQDFERWWSETEVAFAPDGREATRRIGSGDWPLVIGSVDSARYPAS